MNFRITLFVLILLLTGVASAKAQGHVIRGKVRTSAGVSLPRVTVNLESGTGAMIDQTVTNNEGDFYFSGLSDNSYSLVVSSPDYAVASERVEFVRNVSPNESGETRSVEITLIPKAGVRTGPARFVFAQNIPDAARNAFEKGEQLARQKNSPAAIARFREALQIFPNYFDAHLSLGSLLLTTGELVPAISEFEAARKINPTDVRLYQMFGAAMMQQRKFAVAAAAFAEAARLAPEDPTHLLRRGVALIEYAATFDRTSPQSALTQNQALADAELSLRKAFEVSGKRLTVVHQQLARVYERRGERKQAADELEEYLRRTPADPNAAAIREAVKKLRATPSPAAASNP